MTAYWRVRNYVKRALHCALRLSNTPLLFIVLISIISTSTKAITLAGITDGSGTVNTHGAYTYSIPLKLPAGINGLTPTLSLYYNSQSRHRGSPLGQGWGLSGLSEIHRCGQAIAIEGKQNGIKYDEDDDRLCKDGVRLVGDSEGDYWSANYYHPVREDWSKVIPVGACYEGPCYFIVYTKDRRTLYYGSVSAARSVQLDYSGIGRWHLNKVVDANNNEINIQYTSAGGNSLVVDKITYGKSNLFEVRFSYSDKPQIHWVRGYYSNGEDIDDFLYKKRLDTISIYANNVLFKQYKQTYLTSHTNQRALLKTVQECDAKGDCYDPIEFEWNNPGLNNGIFDSFVPTLAQLDISKTSADTKVTDRPNQIFDERIIMGAHQGFGAHMDYGVNIIPGDWNSDGKTDFIRQEYCANPTGLRYLSQQEIMYGYCYGPGNVLQDGNGFGFHLSNGDGTFESYYPNNYSQQNNHIGFMEIFERLVERDKTNTGSNIIPGDFNGDGHLDYIRQEFGLWAKKDNANTAQVYLNTGLNAQGFPQFSRTELNAGQDEIYLKGSHDDEKKGVQIIPGDFDGDSKTDFLRIAQGEWANEIPFATYLSNGNGTFRVNTANDFDDVKGLVDNSGINVVPGDFNGDGRTDFLRQEFGAHASDSSNSFGVYFSNGDGSFRKHIPTSIDTNHLKGSHAVNDGFQGVVLHAGDFNGDGLTDFLRQEYGAWSRDSINTFQVYFSKGNGEFDVVTPSGNAYQQNLKQGDDYEEPLAAKRNDGKKDLPNTVGANLILADYNGDGLTDFIRQESRQWVQNNSSKTFQVYLSRGNGYFDILTPPDNSSPQRKLKGLHWYEREYYEYGEWLDSEYGSWFRVGVQLLPGDYDGDNRVDFIAHKWDGGTKFFGDNGLGATPHIPPFSLWFHPLAGQVKENTLKLVRQGRVEHHIQYALSSDHDTRSDELPDDLPDGFRETRYPLWLVSELAIKPEIENDSAYGETIEYRYGLPVAGRTSGLLGFTHIKESHLTKKAQIKTEYDFLEKNGVPFSIPKATHSYADNAALVDTKQILWELKEKNGAVALQMSQKTIEKYFENGESISEIIQYDYDEYSNIIKETRTQGDVVSSTISGYRYDEANWVLAQLASVATATGSCTVHGNVAVCDAKNKLKETKFDYYANGNIKEKAVVSSWTPYQALKNRFTYYSNGQLKTTTDPLGVTVEYDYSIAGHTETVTENTLIGTKDALIETTDFDLRWGIETQSTDANGYVQQQQKLDTFGRLTEVYNTDEYGQLFKTLAITRHWISGEQGDLFKMRNQHYTDWSGETSGERSYYHNTYVDVFGHKVKENQVAGTTLFSEKEWQYNPKGQLVKESLTHRGSNKQYTTYTYNDRGRTQTVQPAVGHAVVLSYEANSPLCADNQVAVEQTINDRVTIQCKNFNDQAVKVIHDPDNENFSQIIQHNALGQVIEIKDDSGFKTTAKYDGLERQIEKTSTERGKEVYHYNSETGLLDKSEHFGVDNSELGHVKYEYNDDLSRLTKEIRSDGSTVIYQYDDPDLDNNKGRLSRVILKQDSDVLLKRELSYHPTSLLKAMNVALDGKDYGFSYKYTPQGKQHKIFYPSARVVTYSHNALGLVEKIRSNGKLIASYEDFDSSGRYGKAVFNNGVTEQRQFDAYHRVDDLRIHNGDADLLSQHFVYNPHGEIKEITDYLEANNTQVYTYNKMGYLKSATGPWDGTLEYEYDPNGNITKKDGKRYHYTGNLLTGVGDDYELKYNKGGGLEQKIRGTGTNQVVTHFQYDSLLRLKTVTQGGKTSEFTYDEVGTRFMKKSADGRQVFYLSPEYEIYQDASNNMRHTDFVFGPGGRIASFTPKASNGAALAGFAKHKNLSQLYGTGSLMGLSKKAYHSVAMVVSHPNSLSVISYIPSVSFLIALLWFVIRYLRAAEYVSVVGRLRHWIVAGFAQLKLISAQRQAQWELATGTQFMADNRRLAMGVPMALLGMLMYIGLPGSVDRAEAAEGDPEGTQYYHSNLVGSTSLVTNCNGDVMARPIYKPFGEVYSGEGSRPYRYGFGGKEKDLDTGLHYFSSRYYDAELGRFIQPDLRAAGTNGLNAAQLNRYSYTLNNPVNYADPSGEFISMAFVVGAITAALISATLTVGVALLGAAISGQRVDFKAIAIQAAIAAAFAVISVGVGMVVANYAGATSGIVMAATLESGLAIAETYASARVAGVGVSWKDALIAGVIGAVSGAAGGAMARRAANKAASGTKTRSSVPVATPVDDTSIAANDVIYLQQSNVAAIDNIPIAQPIPTAQVQFYGGVGNVIAGHGALLSRRQFQIPDGITLTTWLRHGSTMPDRMGQMIERGEFLRLRFFSRFSWKVRKKVHKPGSYMWDYTISPAGWSDIYLYTNSIQVDQPTLLSDVLRRQSPGDYHLATCQADRCGY